jgi:hypothetical protein
MRCSVSWVQALSTSDIGEGGDSSKDTASFALRCYCAHCHRVAQADAKALGTRMYLTSACDISHALRRSFPGHLLRHEWHLCSAMTAWTPVRISLPRTRVLEAVDCKLTKLKSGCCGSVLVSNMITMTRSGTMPFPLCSTLFPVMASWTDRMRETSPTSLPSTKSGKCLMGCHDAANPRGHAPSRSSHQCLGSGGCVGKRVRARIFSSSVGAVKPSPRVFLTALELMSVEPAQALFVSDSMERDIRPAMKLGFNTAFVGPKNESAGANLVVASIAELLHVGEREPSETTHPAAQRPRPNTA